MIQRLRRKFILVSIGALLVVIVTLVGGLASISYYRAHQQIDTVLTILSQKHDQLNSEDTKQQFQQRFGPKFNREGIYQYRYFTATVSADGQDVSKIDDTHIMTVPRNKITTIAKQVNQRGDRKGTIHYNKNTYAYQVNRLPNGDSTITFLDSSIIMTTTNEIIKSGIYLGGFSLLLFALVLALFSKRAIRPVEQAEQRQKEFITNAGHELKTPLAVISANTEMDEMMNGENEWTRSNKQQVEHLTRLIGHLISLARFQENANIDLAATNISQIVKEASDSFTTVITHEDKEFHSIVAPDLTIMANRRYFYELISILLDNANKYCDPHGKVTLSLQKSPHGKYALFAISNSYADGKDVDYHKFFERFYRHDQSHHHGKQDGFGIGLSMALELVNTFNGKINAQYKDGCTVITMRFKLI